MYCKYCGKEILETSKFCGNCGAEIIENREVLENKSKRQTMRLTIN